MDNKNEIKVLEYIRDEADKAMRMLLDANNMYTNIRVNRNKKDEYIFCKSDEAIMDAIIKLDTVFGHIDAELVVLKFTDN